MIPYHDDTVAWDNWRRAAARCGAHYRALTRGVDAAQLGPMIIVGGTSRVAGEDAHQVSTDGTWYVQPEGVANEDYRAGR